MSIDIILYCEITLIIYVCCYGTYKPSHNIYKLCWNLVFLGCVKLKNYVGSKGLPYSLAFINILFLSFLKYFHLHVVNEGDRDEDYEDKN